MFRMFVSSVIVATAIAAASAASATVITPVGVTASSEWGIWGPTHYRGINVINGSGLEAGLHDGDFNNMWLTWEGTSATLDFDLGADYQLTGINIWNYNSDIELERGAQDFVLSVSLDGVGYSQILAGSLSMGTGGLIPAESFALDGLARYVRLDILNNHGGAWVGLSEVNFTAVPEPAALPLLGAGVGLLGLSLRRRRA
ncbi:discoidin domain-containing protein [Pedomonas mirosovicensis]|uniref:discoidin domain-containing protein n=1 Tax=Pedomonas mirosovicensis TaxID=2908641 RepID=UPI002168257E|nr:discoidin domain-containing protein [Pedomonas mirosovicensis]MCH8684195.1 discoidin domain-containing protein [Pedomonas mirosovicensis]